MLALGAAARACTPFESAPEDASSASDSGAAIDATASDSGAPPAETDAAFANKRFDDFNRTDQYADFWNTVREGDNLTLASGEVCGGSPCLVADIPPGTTSPSMLTLDLGVAKRVRVSWKMKVLSRGQGEIDFVAVRTPGESAAVLLVHTAETGRFAAQHREGSTWTTAAFDDTFREWTSLSLSVDTQSRTAELRSGDRILSSDSQTNDWEEQPILVELGARWVPSGGTQGDWQVAFDDVTISWE